MAEVDELPPQRPADHAGAEHAESHPQLPPGGVRFSTPFRQIEAAGEGELISLSAGSAFRRWKSPWLVQMFSV
jgi:hypothetical protein